MTKRWHIESCVYIGESEKETASDDFVVSLYHIRKMLLNFPYHRNWYQEAQNSSNCLHRWLLTAVLCGWRHTKSFGTACQDVERILVIVLKWIYGTWGDMCIVSVFVSLLPTKHRRAFCILLLCLCVYFLRGSTGHCIQGLSFRPYWWDLILTTSEIALSHFTRMTQIALLSFCCISGSCRVRAAEAWIVTLANCLWPDTAPTLPVTLWEVLFQTCRTHDHAVLCCPSWNLLYKFDINLWGRGTSSWAVSI